MMKDEARPWLEVLVPLWQQPEPYFQIPPKAAKHIPGKKDPYRVVPDDKAVAVHKLASTKDSLVAVYPEAIAITTPIGRERAGAWLAVAIAALAVSMFAYVFFYEIKVQGTLTFASLAAGVAVLGFSLAAYWMYRILQHAPPERPILFCRKTRQVAYFVPHLPRFWKFWEPIPVELRRHHWDDIRVRSYRTHAATGVTVREVFHLLLLWGGEGGDPRMLKDFGAVGFEDTYSDTSIFQLWEHIRRYMEEGGPPIQPGEKLREPGNKNKPLEFPPDLLAAAGGPPLSREEVARLAALRTGA